jgi:serine/threonine protein kinase
MIVFTFARWISLWLFLEILGGAVSSAPQCNTSSLWQNQNSCVVSVVDDRTATIALRCVSHVCNVASALRTPFCTPSTDLASLAAAQSTCLTQLGHVTDTSSQSFTINATLNTSDSMFRVLDDLLAGNIMGCDFSSQSVAAMESCLSRLSCRTRPSTLCTPVCLAQTLTCMQTYNCGAYFLLNDISGSPLSYVFDMVPLDALYCQSLATNNSNASSATSWNQTAWILEATQLLSLSNHAPSGPSSVLTQYYVVVPGVIALLLLVVGTTVATRKYVLKCYERLQRKRGDAERAEIVESNSFPDEEWCEPPTVADSPPTALVSRSQSKGQALHHHFNATDQFSSGVPTAWPSKGRRFDMQHFQNQDYEGDDCYQEREGYRPRSQYVTSKVHEGHWDDREDMLFVEEEDYGHNDHQRITRASSTDDRTSAATTTGGDDRARLEIPIYSGASGHHRRQNSQASLAELEFAFSDPSRTNGSSSQHVDDVIRLEPAAADEDEDGSNSDRGQILTPMSNSDTDEQRLVFDQESLRSSTNSQNRDDVIAAGSVMSRRDILHSILRGNFVRGRLLGRGTHGAVYQMNLTESKVTGVVSVAMKEIDVQQCSRDELSKIISRFNFLSRLSHRHIVEQYVVRYEPSTLSLNVWMEFLGGGTLTQLAKTYVAFPQPPSGTSPEVDELLLEPPIATLKHRPHGPQSSSRSSLNNGRSVTPATLHTVPSVFPERDVVRIVPQLLSALSYLHRKGVIHRDVKGSNVLMTADYRSAKLADLDVCYISSLANLTVSKSSDATPLEHMHHSVAGSPLWMPPEILSSRCGPAPSTDIWSLGITIAESLMGGALPWPRFDTTFNAMVYITHPGHPPVLRRTDVSETCQDFLHRCWDANADLRPSAMELRSHPWFQLSRPSSFRRVPSDNMGAATKSATTCTNNSARSYDSSLVWEDPGEAGAPTLGERQESLKKRFDESAMEAEMKRLDEELSLL